MFPASTPAAIINNFGPEFGAGLWSVIDQTVVNNLCS